MKVGVFSPYLDTLGGGERYIFTVAEFYIKQGHKVEIIGGTADLIEIIKQRFDIDVTGTKFVTQLQSSKYDLLFFLSDGSIPLSFAKKTILHFQAPFDIPNQRNVLNKIKFSRINKVVCNSNFTKNYIDKTFGIKSEVLYPPVDIKKFSKVKKENLIISVGRFHSPSHPKKQQVMVDVFNKMKLKDWKLVLLGGGQPDIKLSGKKVKIISNADFSTIKEYYSKAKIYWHATGFGENDPMRMEHFGITTVEAMASGCIPVVFAGGGQKEIIQHEINGYLWTDIDQLENFTRKAMQNSVISSEAILRASDFSKEVFFEKLNKITS